MTNSEIIEGHTENSGCSDLNLAIGYAGRWDNIPDGDYLFGGSGASLQVVSLRKPATEKEARLRPQHFTFSRSRMGWLESDAHVRGVAVTQRLPSALLLGAGDYSFVNASEGFKGWGANEVALPRS